MGREAVKIQQLVTPFTSVRPCSRHMCLLEEMPFKMPPPAQSLLMTSLHTKLPDKVVHTLHPSSVISYPLSHPLQAGFCPWLREIADGRPFLQQRDV